MARSITAHRLTTWLASPRPKYRLGVFETWMTSCTRHSRRYGTAVSDMTHELLKSRRALEEGERSGLADDYSLEGTLAKLGLGGVGR